MGACIEKDVYERIRRVRVWLQLQSDCAGTEPTLMIDEAHDMLLAIEAGSAPWNPVEEPPLCVAGEYFELLADDQEIDDRAASNV